MRPALVILVWCAVSGHVSADDDPVAVVRRLGAALFADREEADRQLRSMGAGAYKAVKAGLRDADAEIRKRCGLILAEVRVPAMKSKDHPAWKKFAAVAGDGPAAFDLYEEVVCAPVRAAALDDVTDDPVQAPKHYAAAANGYFTKSEINYYKLEHSGRKATDRFAKMEVQTFTRADVAVLLYLGSFPDTDKVLHEDKAKADSFFYLKGYEQLTHHGPGLEGKPSPEFRRLYGAWLKPRTNVTACYVGFQIAARLAIKDALPAARAVAGDKERHVSARLHALPTIVLFGNPDDLPLFRALFDRREVVSRYLDNGEQGE